VLTVSFPSSASLKNNLIMYSIITSLPAAIASHVDHFTSDVPISPHAEAILGKTLNWRRDACLGVWVVSFLQRG
jgi:hypothetical protein